MVMIRRLKIRPKALRRLHSSQFPWDYVLLKLIGVFHSIFEIFKKIASCFKYFKI
jgi:hypothetical protein